MRGYALCIMACTFTPPWTRLLYAVCSCHIRLVTVLDSRFFVRHMIKIVKTYIILCASV